MTHSAAVHRMVRDRRGVALPLALLGLISVSILVTAVLISGTTELGLSQAHQVGARELFVAESGLEAYVADLQNAGNLNALTPGVAQVYLPPGASSADSVLISVRRLKEQVGGGVTSHTFSITSQPIRGGRTVGATFRVDTNNAVNLNITSAATFGGNAQIHGSAVLVSDGSRQSDVSECNPNEAAPNAIVNAAGSTLTVNANPTIIGDTVTSHMGKEDLIRNTLGSTIRGLLPRATRKFGPHFNAPSYGQGGAHTTTPSSLQNNGSLRDTSHSYNWHCPGLMDDQNNCLGRGADTTVYHIIAIDAENRQITINGDHGQGMLIVINGRLRIQGNFIFRGVVVGEQDIDMAGTGNKVQGAIISQNNINLNQQQAADDTTSVIGGNAMVVFNSCAIAGVMQALNPGNPTPIFSVLNTTNWFERLQ